MQFFQTLDTAVNQNYEQMPTKTFVEHLTNFLQELSPILCCSVCDWQQTSVFQWINGRWALSFRVPLIT